VRNATSLLRASARARRGLRGAPPAAGPPVSAASASAAALLLLLLLHLQPCARGAGAAAAEAPGRPARFPDPVVANNAVLKGLFDGTPVEQLRALAYRDGDFRAIPFQVDERGPLCELLLTQGPLRGQQRGEGDGYTDAPSFGLFNGGDEFVLLARHMAERAPAGLWPPGASRAAEIRARDPAGGFSAWAYLAAFPSPPERVPDDYVDYRVRQPEDGRPEVHVVSNHYHAAFTDPDKPVAQSGWHIIHQGREGPNILRTFHSIIDVRLGVLHFDFTLENIIPRRLGQIDGPVRVVRRIRNNVRLAGIPLPEFIVKRLSGAALDTDSFYYPDFFYFDGKLTVPKVLIKYGQRSRSIFTTDLNRNAVGMLWMNAQNREPPCLVDGVMSPQERSLDPALYRWCLLHGPPGGWMNILTFGEGFRPMDVRLYYLDNMADGFRPEGDPPLRAYASTGYRVRDFHRIEHRKPLEFTTYIFPVDPDFRPGDEQPYVDMIFRPLEVSAAAFLGGDAAPAAPAASPAPRR